MLSTPLLNTRPNFVPNGVDFHADFTRGKVWHKNQLIPLEALLADTHADTLYAPNSDGVYIPYPANKLVYNSNGLQTTPGRTNLLRNNSMQGASVETNTWPDNWGYGNGVGTTETIVDAGTVDGIEYIDVRVAGTTGDGNGVAPYFEAGTFIAAVLGETFTESVFLALVGGTLTNVNSINLTLTERNSGGTYLLLGAGADIKASLTATMQRFSMTRAMTQATCAYVQPRVYVAASSGVVVDYTIRIGRPQVEKASALSANIRTSAGAVTVAGNQQTISNLGSLLNKGFYGVVQWYQSAPAISGYYARVLDFNDGTGNNFFIMQDYNGTGQLCVQTTAATVAQGTVYTPSAGTFAVGLKTAAFACGPGFQSLRLVGDTAPTADTSVDFPVVDRIGLLGRGYSTDRNNYAVLKKLSLKFGAPDATSFADMFKLATRIAA